nr:MAG TPA: hypothetical protein [Caudoviricetes sp.]
MNWPPYPYHGCALPHSREPGLNWRPLLYDRTGD